MTINVPGISGWWLVKAGLFFAFVSTILTIATSQWAASEPLLASAAAVDLIFAIPLAYFILIRRSSIPKVTVLPVFFAFVTIAYFLTPQVGQGVVSAVITYALLAVEIFAFGFIVLRLGRIIRAYRQTNDEGLDVLERLRSAFSAELHPAFLARAAAFEAAGVVFAFGKWRKPTTRSQFSYHRNAIPVLAVFLFLLIAETVVIHIVISMWSSLAAWIVTGLSVYFGFQLFGHFKAVILRPIVITENNLFVRCGLIADSQIELDKISKVVRRESADPTLEPSIAITPAGPLLRPNINLTFSDEVSVFGFYGITKRTRSLDINVDDPDAFVEAMRN